MGKYTMYQENWVDRGLQKYLDILIGQITQKIDDVISIILSGGFGRGEGSVILKQEQVSPLNDFDIYIVTKNKAVSEDDLNSISDQFGKITGIPKISLHIFKRDELMLSDLPYSQLFYADLKAFPLNYFKNLPPMIRYYELKEASTVIWGDKTIFDQMIDCSVSDLPLAEGLRLLLNRMSHLLQFPPAVLFAEGDAKERTHQILLFHVIKAYSACCASLLLLSGKYSPTYRGQMEIFEKSFKADFPDLYREIPELSQKISEFTGLKLKIDFSKYRGEDFKIWDEARNYIGTVVKYFLKKFLETKTIDSWDDFSNLLRNKSWAKYYNPYLSYYLEAKTGVKIKNNFILSNFSFLAQQYFNLLHFQRTMRYQNKFYPYSLLKLVSPELNFFSALPYILFSVKSDKTIDLGMLNKGRKILKRSSPVGEISRDPKKYWADIALDYSNAYILFSFLKIV